MATGKQINELTPAISVGSADYVALSQPGGSEAVKATTTQLAQAVAEINETGALSELTYATSQGKALLAQYLTNKGIPTEASETLIQMAAKVNSMQIEDGNGALIAKNILNYKDNTSNTTDSNTCVFRNPVNRAMVIVYQNMVYYVPYADTYTNISDMMSAATHTFDLTTIDASYSFSNASYVRNCIAMSEDFTKIAIPVAYTSTTSHTAVILNVDSTSGFTHLYTIANKNLCYLYNGSNYGSTWAVNNAGTHIAFCTNSPTSPALYIYDIAHDTDYHFGQIGQCVKLLMKNKALYFVQTSSGGSVYNSLNKIPYTIASDGSVTFGTRIKTNESYSGSLLNDGNLEWANVPGEDIEPVLMITSTSSFDATSSSTTYGPGNNSSYPATALYHAYINTVRITPAGTYETRKAIIARFKGQYNGNGISNNIVTYIGCVKNLILKSHTSTTITYEHPVFHNNITINVTTGSISVDEIKNTLVMSTYSSSIGNGYYWYIGKYVCYNPSNTSMNSNILGTTSQYRYENTIDDSGYYIGFVRTDTQGNQAVFTYSFGGSSIVSLNDLEAYKVAPEITPTVPDEA